MPWTIIIQCRDGGKLGQIDALRDRFSECVPGLQFYREPSGKEKLAASSIEYPEVVRRHLERSPAQIQADCQVGSLFLRFFFGPEDATDVDSVAVEVRGEGNPIPVLAAICSPNGWIAQAPDGAELDLSADTSPEWEHFRAWRDRETKRGHH